MKKILFPVDKSLKNSSACRKAFDQAEIIANSYNSTITVFHSFDYHKVPSQKDYAVQIDKLYSFNTCNEALDEISDYFSQKGIKSNTKLTSGDPASNIIDEADEGEYDLIIICTHGMSPGKRFLIGSVTDKVVHNIRNTPILIVR